MKSTVERLIWLILKENNPDLSSVHEPGDYSFLNKQTPADIPCKHQDQTLIWNSTTLFDQRQVVVLMKKQIFVWKKNF